MTKNDIHILQWCMFMVYVFTMNRTQIYLEEEQIRQLDLLANREGVRRSALVRRAIDLLLTKFKGQPIAEREEVVREAQKYVQSLVSKDDSLVEEILQDRRDELSKETGS